ncbi:MAG: FliA/WhiG family RNA polymerase sigma factor [Syntrophales bacterium]|nr:FliA/WhiG family RNA polymerase sigma factor [Syntrophales bacterium]
MSDNNKRNELVVKYAPLDKNIVERMALRLPPHVDRDDLISAGTIGLISAVERFDNSRNVQFETFARFRIRGAILDDLRSRDVLSRSSRSKDTKLETAYRTLRADLGREPSEEEVADFMGLSLEGYYSLLDEARGLSLLSSEDLPPDYVERNAHADVLEKIQDGNPFVLLKEKQVKRVLRKAIESLPDKEGTVLSLYYYEELTLKEIGVTLGLTESRICQIHARAMMRLRSALKPLGIEGDAWR